MPSILKKKSPNAQAATKDLLAEQLSFLPEQYLERKRRRRTDLICLSLFAAVVAGTAGAGYVKYASLGRAERLAETARNEHVEAARLISQVQELRERQATMAHQAELSASLLETVPRSYLLAELTNHLPDPDHMALTDLELKAARATAAAAPPAKTAFEQRQADDAPAAPQPLRFDVSLKLSGLATDHAQVSAYLARLKDSPLIGGVRDVETKRPAAREGQPPVIEFAFELTLRADADARRALAAAAPLNEELP